MTLLKSLRKTENIEDHIKFLRKKYRYLKRPCSDWSELHNYLVPPSRHFIVKFQPFTSFITSYNYYTSYVAFSILCHTTCTNLLPIIHPYFRPPPAAVNAFIVVNYPHHRWDSHYRPHRHQQEQERPSAWTVCWAVGTFINRTWTYSITILFHSLSTLQFTWSHI